MKKYDKTVKITLLTFSLKYPMLIPSLKTNFLPDNRRSIALEYPTALTKDSPPPQPVVTPIWNKQKGNLCQYCITY